MISKSLYGELDFSFARSSGPGGQNVNKVNSKAVLRWNVLESSQISEFVRAQIFKMFRSKINDEGDLILSSTKTRDQKQNIQDCLKKFEEILMRASTPPKVRKKTKPPPSSAKKREGQKRKQSEKKRLRGRFTETP